MSTIFLDESGYTGQDLLNVTQPTFTLASLNLPEPDCIELKNKFFNKVQGAELKYSSLSRRPRQQNFIINFLKELSYKPNLVKFVIAHKQYVLVTKMVEILIEPATYEDGLNLYDKGANIALSNLIHYTFPVFGGEVFFKKLLINFQNMIRLKTKESYKAFFEPLSTQDYPQDLVELLTYLRGSHTKFGYGLLEDYSSLDIATSCTLSLMSYWQHDLSEDLILIHDNSSAMAKDRRIWDVLVDHSLHPIEVGYDRRKTQFPIRVVETHPEDSKNWAGLQLADILAGAFSRSVKWLYEGQNADDDFGRRLAEICGESFDCLPIWPQREFTPEQMGTTSQNAADPLDYVCSLLMQNL